MGEGDVVKEPLYGDTEIMRKVEALIEKGTDGLYAITSSAMIGHSYLGGYGESVEEAKEDFVESIREALEEAENAGLQHPVFEELSISYTYDIPSFFNYFDFINLTKFASLAGINESKMRQYKSGIAHPGEKTAKKIISTIKQIGTELVNANL